MKYMLDTNICIYAIKRDPIAVFHHLQQCLPGEVCISAVTYAELVHGIEKSKAKARNRLALTLLLSNIEIMNFNSKAAESYGKIRAELETGGKPIGSLDMMIAGHALALECILVTNNIKEFKRIKDLQIENWAEL